MQPQQNSPGQNYPAPQPQQVQPQMVPPPGMPGQGQPNNIFVPPPGYKPPENKKPISLIVIIAVLSLVVIALAVLSVMLYRQMAEYRDDYQAKAAVDIEKALVAQEEELNAEFAEREKAPNRTYVTPNSAASVKIVYPKTWDLYTQEDTEKGEVDNYFNQNAIPDTSEDTNTYSLRLEVLDRNYPDVTRSFDSAVKSGEVTIKPYVAKNVKDAETGIRVDGIIRGDITGSMVILPIRDKTLQIWTESGKYTNDFDKIILENLTYNP